MSPRLEERAMDIGQMRVAADGAVLSAAACRARSLAAVAPGPRSSARARQPNPGSKGCLSALQTVPFGGVISSTRYFTLAFSTQALGSWKLTWP